jgi:hypothetical protein
MRIGSRMTRIKFHGDALLRMVQYHCPLVMAIKVNGIRSESFQHLKSFSGSYNQLNG